MSARPFFDTNVLLYLLASDAKADRAEQLLEAGGVISVQVLNEFAAVASRKLKMAWPEIREILATIRSICEVVPLTGEVHDAGLAIADRHQLSFYDSLIIAAAELHGCPKVFSEDMTHGQKIGGVIITNPF
ncbi:MAG TPA: PIN domain-containing protein [Prosthecobacter sp.]